MPWPPRASAAIKLGASFHPQQCGVALRFAEQRLATNGNRERALSIRAEALLCLGLLDDPAALDQAIAALSQLTEAEPDNFFLRYDLAQALAKRFFLGQAAQQAFVDAQRLVRSADVGAARPELESELREDLDRLEQDQQHFLPILGEQAPAFTDGQLSSHEAGQYLALLAQTGPEGLERALSAFDSPGPYRDDAIVRTLYRAEVLRGRVADGGIANLYRAAEMRLCGSESAADRQGCRLARSRLEDLHARERETTLGPTNGKEGEQ